MEFEGGSVRLSSSAQKWGAIALLVGTPTTVCEGADACAGKDAVLVAGVQLRNNARVVVAQSPTVLLHNKLFADHVLKWAFQKVGVLRVKSTHHVRVDGSQPETQLKNLDQQESLPRSTFPEPEIAPRSLVYRIKDEVVFSIEVEEIQADGSWAPFVVDDMQMEFVMLDAHVREYLVVKGDAMQLQFRIPDVYGVFQFRVVYRRPGYSYLKSTEQISIRPFRQNEYERFIVSAYPYYTSTFSLLASFVIFSFYFVNTK